MLQLRERLGPIQVVNSASLDLVGAQVTQTPQQVRHSIRRACAARIGQCLELELKVGHGLRINEFAKLLGAEQLGEQVAVERQRLGTALGERRVTLVHERADVIEQQRRSERRGRPRLDAHDPNTT